MHTTETIRNPAPLAMPATAAATDAPPRFDMYQPIHKALRAHLCSVLVQLGALDADDPAALHTTLAQTRDLLETMDAHLAHENAFVHPAIEAAARGASSQIAGEHEAHTTTIQALRDEVDALAAEPSAERALRLYRHFALFVAENLSHMHFEETVHNAALWAGYSDAELQALEGRLLASIAPDEMGRTLRWMLPAINHGQRVGLIQGMRQVAPPQAVDGVLQLAWSTLDGKAWSKLAHAVGAPAVPGLMVA